LNATNPLLEGVQVVELGLKDATETITDKQRQVTKVHRTHTAMQQAMTALQASVDCQQHRQHDDDGDASVQGGGDAHTPDDHDCFASKAGGHGNGGHGGGCAGGGQAAGGVDLLPNVCVVNLMILISQNQSTVMSMGWTNQKSPCPNSWVLLMLKSISIGS
jgi:hypothetical protein